MQKLYLLLVLIMIGTVGVFTAQIPLSTGMIAFFRSLFGALFVLIFVLIKRQRFDLPAIKRNAFLLFLSGTALGFNWVLLFESFRRSGVAVGTLCYYMAPVIVILSSPVLLKERLTLRKLLCTAFALCGMVFVSGIFGDVEISPGGIGYGLAAAVLYAAIMICNKKITGVPGLQKSFCQLFSATIIMLIYVILTDDFGTLLGLDLKACVFLIIIGVFHTGVFYSVYFTAIGSLPAQTTAIISYVDPISSILSGAIFLSESLDAFQIFGTVLILGSAICSEITFKKKQV